MDRRIDLASHVHRSGLLVLASALVAGCTNLLTPMGENTYDCNRKENPASPYCHSFKSVEASTNGPIPPSRYDETMRLADFDRMTGIAPVPRGEVPSASTSSYPAGTAPAQTASHGMAAPRPSPSLEGLPVREGPVVQRVWVKRFVDGNDLLIGETVIYKEIIGSHWLGFGRGDAPAGGKPATSTRDGARYPHRPPQPQPSKATSNLSSPAEMGSGAQGATPASTPPGFTQPGAPAPERGEMAPVPASPSGTNSMPQ